MTFYVLLVSGILDSGVSRRYSEAIQKIFRSYPEAIQKLFRSYSEAIRKLLRSHSEAIEKLFRSYPEAIQIQTLASGCAAYESDLSRHDP